MGKADLHMHSVYSDGGENVESILRYVDAQTDLDIIAITDHDCIDGALRARDVVAKNRLRIQTLLGVEISTRDGHLLALNIERLIPANLSMTETIQAVHEQGGVAIAAHPLCRWCPSASLEILLELCSAKISALRRLDGVEVINSSFAGLLTNRRVRTLNQTRLQRAETGGSDAHTLHAIGASYTRFPGSTPAELLDALHQRTTHAAGGLWSIGAFMAYSRLSLRQHVGRGNHPMNAAAPTQSPLPAQTESWSAGD